VTRGTDVFKLGAKLGMDPMELLRLINGKTVPTKAVVQELAKELDSDVSYLTKLAAEIKPLPQRAKPHPL
jgi:transcriptional regulator with XRE-family HTH domain